MDKKGTLQSRLRKICAEIDEIKNEEKKELSKIEEKTRRVNSFRRDFANMLEQKYQASVQELKNNEDQVVDYEKIQLEYKTKLRKKSEEIEDLQMKIHRLEDEG